MAQTLRYDTLKQILHIALLLCASFFMQKGYAQTILLPGDIVVVSVNEDGDSFDFIPLMEIERGTEIYFSDGAWDQNAKELSGNYMLIQADSTLEAGSNVHVGDEADNRISVEGRIDFRGDAYQLFAYQYEGDQQRIIYGLEWGSLKERNPSANSGYPYNLAETEQAYLVLGEEKNYQYHIRNGASGTHSMLKKFVGNPGNWRGSATKSPGFGTSFNLLEPPVILFENSVSTVSEDSSEAVLDVAVYGHDGSRATVEVYYRPDRSSTDAQDIAKTDTTIINFTGLVGDGVYEVKVPLKDDELYEGLETGIFVLDNLTKGNFGDFLTHSLIVRDNEIPAVKITNIIPADDKDQFLVEIENREQRPVELKNWTFRSGNKELTINQRLILEPGSILRLSDDHPDLENTVVVQELSDIIPEVGDELALINASGYLVNEVLFSGYRSRNDSADDHTKGVQVAQSTKVGQINPLSADAAGMDENSASGMQIQQQPGWKVFAYDDEVVSNFNDLDLYYWDEPTQSFINVREDTPDHISETSVFGYFNNNMIRRLSDVSSLQNENPQPDIKLRLSSTDRNQNGVIDGLEGLNLSANESDTPFEVHVLLNEILKKAGELNISPYVYTVSAGKNNDIKFNVLEGNDLIAPGQPFWIKLDEALNREVALTLDAGAFERDIIFEEENEEQAATLELFMSGAGQKETIQLSFTENPRSSYKLNLAAFTEMQFPGKEQASFSVRRNESYLQNLEYAYELSRNLSLPISFGSSVSGEFTLTVSEWPEFPDNWKFTLTDTQTGEEFEIDKDFKFSFRFRADQRTDGEQVLPAAETVNQEERFMLNVYPPLAQDNTDESIDNPKELELYQNFPNPFNPYTTISFYLPEQAEVKLSIFNVVGQPVAVLMEGSLSVGRHEFEWDATDMPSSMYIYQLEVGNKIITRKMTLVK